MELGMSDHYAQILSIPIKSHGSSFYKIYEKQINEDNIQEFLYLLRQESWQEVYREVDVNQKYNKFLDNFLYYYDIAFPLMLTSKAKKKKIKEHRITEGIKNSSRRMRLLEKYRKEINLEQEELQYINTYRNIYRNVIKEAKTKDNDNYLTNAKNKTKAS
jgi:hypothetical protein